MNRQIVAQQPPPPGLDLSEFPTQTPESPGEVFRAYGTDRPDPWPWWFSNDGGGRFDLSGQRGTCYVADAIGAALRERLGEQFLASRVVAPEDARKMSVARLKLPSDLHAAALLSAGVAEYPITGELTGMPDYACPQAWAAAFDSAGFDGIHYAGRYSYMLGPSWAIFDTAGLHRDRDVLELVHRNGFDACKDANITVLPAEPTELAGLTIVDPPKKPG